MTQVTKSVLMVCAVAGLLVLAQGDAQAQSPEDIAARCVGHVNQTVERCRSAAADEVSECVPLIRRLVAAGRIDAAHQVARRCISSAENRTENCVDHVKQTCRRCINILQDLGAIELARRVAYNCDRAVEDLRHILAREKNAILTALNG